MCFTFIYHVRDSNMLETQLLPFKELTVWKGEPNTMEYQE